LSLARLDSVYHDRAREFNDPNFGFSESCTKKNALTKLARMSRVRHNAISIENRYNSLKILTKLFETFCPLHEIVWKILPTCCFHVEIPCKIVQFSRIFLKMQGYLWIIWVKLAGALWIIWVKIRQLINILFCGYRQLEIGDPWCRNLYSSGAQGAPASNK
jgi:hypothetical protein